MKTVPLAPYVDDAGNRVEFTGPPSEAVKITFRGKNNVARIHPDALARKLSVDFNGNNGTFELGSNPQKRGFSASVRVGQDASVRIGDGVSSTSGVLISAVEGVTVSIGDDTMFASNNQVRADDGHPIFDVHTGKRVNVAGSISIGAHTWVGIGAIVLAGVEIGEGTVIGANSIVTRSVPNNVIAVGSPAKVTRTDIAWERPHLGLTEPFYKPDASTITKSKYWRRTDARSVAKDPAKDTATDTATDTAKSTAARPPRKGGKLAHSRHRVSRLLALRRGRRTS